MQPFICHAGLAAAMLQDNINTDLIIPKQFLKTIHRRGLGCHLFHDLRYREDGSEEPGFVLNREPGRTASILLAGANFGCGSSRSTPPGRCWTSASGRCWRHPSPTSSTPTP